MYKIMALIRIQNSKLEYDSEMNFTFCIFETYLLFLNFNLLAIWINVRKLQ